jgi:hypothetical protein
MSNVKRASDDGLYDLEVLILETSSGNILLRQKRLDLGC